MPSSLKDLDWFTWLTTLWKSVISGAANAVLTAPVISAISPKEFSFNGWKIYTAMGSIFLWSVITHVFAFLAKSPLPDAIVTTTTETTITHPPSPTQTVVKTVETQESHPQ
jgi:hypothetical protein